MAVNLALSKTVKLTNDPQSYKILPSDILIKEIGKYLGHYDLINANLVCRHWSKCYNNENLWKSRYDNLFRKHVPFIEQTHESKKIILTYKQSCLYHELIEKNIKEDRYSFRKFEIGNNPIISLGACHQIFYVFSSNACFIFDEDKFIKKNDFSNIKLVRTYKESFLLLDGNSVKLWNASGIINKISDTSQIKTVQVWGDDIVTCDINHCIKLWDKNNFSQIFLQLNNSPQSMIIVNNHLGLVLGNNDKVLELWDKNKNCIQKFVHDSSIIAIISYKNNIVTSDEKNLIFWNLNGSYKIFPMNDSNIKRVSYEPSSILTILENNTLLRWDENGNITGKYSDHMSTITVEEKFGPHTVFGDSYGLLNFWTPGKPLKTLTGLDPTSSRLYSKYSKILSVSAKNEVCIWDFNPISLNEDKTTNS
ncbi:MAG: hypothetical protein JHC93_06780 [Parachlamydiales bacterium]|nr:hypothetical protein [Parachlamydiales bacterium]